MINTHNASFVFMLHRCRIGSFKRKTCKRAAQLPTPKLYTILVKPLTIYMKMISAKIYLLSDAALQAMGVRGCDALCTTPQMGEFVGGLRSNV